MIREIRIKNFLSLRDIRLEPTPMLNVFVGPNSSGKTNFLAALKFLSHIAVFGLFKALSDRGGFGEVFWKGQTEENQIEFELSVEIPSGEIGLTPATYFIAIQGTAKGLVTVKRESLRVEYKGRPVDVIDLNAGHGTIKHIDGSKAFDPPGDPSISMLEFNTPNWAGTNFKNYLASMHFYDLIPHAMKLLKPFTRVPFLTETGDNLIEFLTTLKTGHTDSFRQIEQVVQDTFPDVEQLIPEPTQAGQVFLTAKERFLQKPVNVWNMAQGELSFIAFAALILSPPEFGAPITAVEEPESHLHPRLLGTLVELLRQTEAKLIAEGHGASQIFVTTHSPYLVDHLNLEELIVAEKARGETHYFSPRDKTELKELLSREPQGLGELWFTGALGGV